MYLTHQFVLAHGWSSSLIVLAGGGTDKLGFSHVDIVWPDGRLFGARDDKVLTKDGKTIGPGVHFRPPEYGDKVWIRKVQIRIAVTDSQARAFYDFLLKQENKPYDQLAILAFLVERDWRQDSAWFCDELGLAALETANIIPAAYLPMNKFTPTGLAVLLSIYPGREIITIKA